MSNKPFKDLTDAEKGALLLAHHEGKRIELYSGEWDHCLKPGFFDHFTYRIAPEPKTPDSINWDHVSPEYSAMARDSDGSVYVYEAVPRLRSDDWGSTQCEDLLLASGFASYRRGTIDWKDSLVIRPGYEGSDQ